MDASQLLYKASNELPKEPRVTSNKTKPKATGGVWGRHPPSASKLKLRWDLRRTDLKKIRGYGDNKRNYRDLEKPRKSSGSYTQHSGGSRL